MTKYGCEKCGYIFEIELEKTYTGDMTCPICKSNMMTEEEFKAKDEITRLIAEDRPDEDITPKQDMNEAVEEFIMEGMAKNIKELGNNGTYEFIERIATAETRIRYRKYFLLVGGQVPEKEPITI